MQNVVLKGHNDGYEIFLKASSNFSDILTELTELFASLKEGKLIGPDQTVAFDIMTGSRLLNAEQKKQIEAIISHYPLFSIHKFSAEVISLTRAVEMVSQRSLHLDSSIIRNGQVKTITGDVLFIGSVHQGGILRATGSIFLMGESEGILQAGYPDHPEAVIAGDFQQAQQIRISDAIAIIGQGKVSVNANTVAFVNDLHVLDYTKRDQIKKIRPKLFAKLGVQ